MKLFIIFFLFHGINLYLIGSTDSHLILNSKNYSLNLIPFKTGLHSDLEKNSILEPNNLFYFLTYDDIYWKNILIRYKNFYFTFYFENLKAFNRFYPEIKNEKKIKILIIGIDSNFNKKEIQLDEINKYIFINKDKQEIKKRYSSFSSKNACYTTINYFYSGDLIFDDFVVYVGIFIIIYILIYGAICYRFRKKNDKYLFIQDYILSVLFFYFFHTLFLYLISTKNKYEYLDEEKYSGALYIIFNCFQFFIKLLPNIFASIQLNIFEVREHSTILGNSKVIHLLSCDIFFIISFQKENPILSEALNCLLYIVNLICICCMYFNYKQLFEEKYEETIQNEPDYLTALNIKKKLLFIHFLFCNLFVAFHIGIYFLTKLFFAEYKTTKFIFIFINYSDLILVFIMTIVHFPRKLPPYYIEEERDPMDPDSNQNIETNNIFRFFYTINYKEKNEEEYFQNYVKDKSPNIVIIENPFSDEKLEETNFKEREQDDDNKRNEIENKGEEEHQILIEKNIINEDKNNLSEIDCLDLTHTKIGFIDLSL